MLVFLRVSPAWAIAHYNPNDRHTDCINKAMPSVALALYNVQFNAKGAQSSGPRPVKPGTSRETWMLFGSAYDSCIREDKSRICASRGKRGFVYAVSTLSRHRQYALYWMPDSSVSVSGRLATNSPVSVL
jgi:hypothetical protein